MTVTTFRHVCIKGEDGNQYIVPVTMEQQFISSKENIIESMCGSDVWFEATDEFNDIFESYLMDS